MYLILDFKLSLRWRNRLNKEIRIATLVLSAILLVSVCSVSAIYYGQNPENKAERIVEIADNAEQQVQELINLVNSNETILEIIENATFLDDFEGNLTLFNDGKAKVTAAYAALGTGDFEGAESNAAEALSIFREVYRSIQIILYDSEVKNGQYVDAKELEEALERAIKRVDELQALTSTEADVYSKLVTAEDLLNQAKNLLASDEVEAAAEKLGGANILISQVCQFLTQIAEETNPSRIRSYLDGVYQYKHRFKERFGQAWNEGFNVNGFLQEHGYQNEEDFLSHLQEMVETAQGIGDLEEELDDLQEIGQMIREMDSALTQEIDHHRARHGQEESDYGHGQGGSGGGSYGQSGSGGSSQKGFGGGP